MSSRSTRSSSKRVSRAQKQSGLLESFTRGERRTAVIDEDEPTVIDLEDGDPYKFVDSQSLLPDSDDGSETSRLDSDLLPLSKLTSTPTVPVQHKAKASPSTGGVPTPRRSRTVLGGATGSAKRKQTPKSKKTPAVQEEWPEDDMERAIAESILEKQREDRRLRQMMRESKAEEDRQLLLSHYQSMAEWEEEATDTGEEIKPTSDRPGLPFDGESSNQSNIHTPNSEQRPSPIQVAGLVSAGSQLKSVSINKLSMKSLQAKKDSKSSDALTEEDEVMVITLRQEGEESIPGSDKAVNVGKGFASAGSNGVVKNGAAGSNMPVKEVPQGIERYCVEDIIVPDDDLDATPPISGQEWEAKGGDDGGRTVVSKPLSRAAPNAANPSKKQLGSDKQGERGKSKTKSGLSLKKGRKRLSDSGNSSFQELPHSSSTQGPASKRPRMEESDTSGRGLTEPNATKTSRKATELSAKAATASDMEVEQVHVLNPAPSNEASVGATAAGIGKRDISGSRDMDTVTKETSIEPAVISLTNIEQKQVIATKGVDVTMNQKEKIDEFCESDKKEKLTATSNSATSSTMATKSTAAYPATVSLQRSGLPKTERTTPISCTTASNGRDTKNEEFQIIRRTEAIGWPPVKIRPSEVPRHPSLRAPPGVVSAEHTKVLVQCFDAYFAKLKMAQHKVLWRIKWGKPVSSINKVGVNSLTSGRRTKRSRAVNIPYSEYALDLKSMAPLSRSKSSSPMVSSKRSTPSKSPVSNIRQQFDPSDENDSDCDFEPFKAKSGPSSRKKLNFNAGADKTNVTTPTTKPPRATKSRLSLGKRSPQLQEKVDKSLSPGVQFEREESPDILPRHGRSGRLDQELSKSNGHGSELEISAKPICSVSPLPPPSSGRSPRANTTPQFQKDRDDGMMFDLTSPSPPPTPPISAGPPSPAPPISAGPPSPTSPISAGPSSPPLPLSAGPQGQKRDGKENDDFATNFNDGEKENLIGEKDASSHIHVSHDDTTDDDSNEAGHLQPAPSAAARSGVASSGGWLDSRKPPPAQQKAKPKRQPPKRTNNSKAGNSNAQSKKKTEGGGGAKGKKPTKKTMSASMRIKALIQKSDSDSEHSSEEASEGASRRNGALTKPPQQKSKPTRRRTMDSSTEDSEITDMELEERGGERGKAASPMIDLTADSQLPPDHTSSSCHRAPSSPSRFPTGSPNDGCVSCPMCGQRFDFSVIQLHAEQCDGPDSDYDSRQWSETITQHTTTATERDAAASGSKSSGLSMHKRQQRGGGKSYQPSLMQLVSKEKEMTREDEDIDSSTTIEDDQLDPDFNLDEDPAARDYADAKIMWTEEEEQSTSTAAASRGGGGGAGDCEEGERGAFAQQSEDMGGAGGGYIIEPSPGSTPQPETVAMEDGEGGYIIDPSMLSDSPIKCFKRLSEMDPEERAWYDDQYKPRTGEQGKRRSQRGRGRGGRGRRLPLTSGERQSATWGRDDFEDLFDTDERSKDQGKRGRGRGNYGGRPMKYDWKKARSRGRGRGRGGSRGRGRRS